MAYFTRISCPPLCSDIRSENPHRAKNRLDCRTGYHALLRKKYRSLQLCEGIEFHTIVLYVSVIAHYIITQVILAFSLVLAYGLLEDRRTIDVIDTKFFPPCLKMAERFENLDNILRDWAKDKVQKSFAEALNGSRSQKTKDKAASF